MGTIKTITALEAFGTEYMTQSADVSLEARMYWRELTGAAPSTEGLRGATAEEREAHIAAVEAMVLTF